MIEGIDYYIYYARFPNRANPANVVPNDDGTYDIYINTLYPQETWRESADHEVRHLEDEHFYVDIPIAAAERQADGDPINIVLHCPEGKIPHFYSEQSFEHWLETLLAQKGKSFGDLPSII